MRLIAVCLAVCAFHWFAPAARAEGLVQITLQGVIESPGGAPVEVELAVWDGTEVDTLSLNLHLGRGTRARDLASLIATRLRRLNARVDFPDENAAGSNPTERVALFIEATTAVNLRLGYGLSAEVTLCDSAPSSVRFMPPQVVEGPADILIAVTTFQAHSRTIGRDSISLDVSSEDGAAKIAEQLAKNALEHGWIADRPRPDSWSCSKNTDGATVTGCSIELNAPEADWRLEVKLAVPQPSTLGR